MCDSQSVLLNPDSADYYLFFSLLDTCKPSGTGNVHSGKDVKHSPKLLER